jgi:BRCA1-associated protein
MPGGYHIRISLTTHTSIAAPSTSSSFKQTHIPAGEPFVPSSLFQHLPAHPPNKTSRRYTIHHSQSAQSDVSDQVSESDQGKGYKDYRFGPLRIDWVDFDTMNLEAAKKGGVGKEKELNARG